jgi:hypothetical protein
MIVDRWTWHVKSERFDEFLDLLTAERKRAGRPTDRIYYVAGSGTFGPTDTVMWEGEYKNEEERRRLWADWWSQPEAREWASKISGMTEAGGSHELWALA